MAPKPFPGPSLPLPNIEIEAQMFSPSAFLCHVDHVLAMKCKLVGASGRFLLPAKMDNHKRKALATPSAVSYLKCEYVIWSCGSNHVTTRHCHRKNSKAEAIIRLERAWVLDEFAEQTPSPAVLAVGFLAM